MMKYEMPRCFATSVFVRAMRIPNFAHLRERRPRLLAVDDVHVAVAYGARAQARQVGARASGSLKSWHHISSPVSIGQR